MRDIYKKTLLESRGSLRAEVLVRHVAPQLRKAGVLSEEEWRRVSCNSQQSDEEQMDSLVDILLTKGDEAFDVLLTALAPNYWWLVAQLQQTYNSHSNSQRNHNQNNINFCVNQRQTAIQKSANTKITADMVKEMRRNSRLIRNWCSLANRLGLGSESVNVQTRVNKECMDQEFCVALLLEAWQNKFPSQATLENLIRHLRAEDFNDVADSLETRYLYH